MNKTLENLCRVFLNKCQTSVRYKDLARLCRERGYGFSHRYFSDFAEQEYEHSLVVSDLINEINGEEQTCEVSIILKNPLGDDILKQLDYEIEREEGNKNKYEVYAKVAFDEGYKEASRVLSLLASAEHNHSMILNDIKLKMCGRDLTLECDKCGFERKGKDKECPLCKHSYVV